MTRKKDDNEQFPNQWDQYKVYTGQERINVYAMQVFMLIILRRNFDIK